MPLQWLSFADPHRPKGQQFLGVVILEAPTFADAVNCAHVQGVNPGGEVVGFELPAALASVIPAEYVRRLLTAEEAESVDRTAAERIFTCHGCSGTFPKSWSDGRGGRPIWPARPGSGCGGALRRLLQSGAGPTQGWAELMRWTAQHERLLHQVNALIRYDELWKIDERVVRRLARATRRKPREVLLTLYAVFSGGTTSTAEAIGKYVLAS